jgi:hypothetical protein
MFAPDRVKASLAISKMRSRFRCASARGFYGLFKHMGLQSETVSVCYCFRRYSPFYKNHQQLVNGDAAYATQSDPVAGGTE